MMAARLINKDHRLSVPAVNKAKSLSFILMVNMKEKSQAILHLVFVYRA